MAPNTLCSAPVDNPDIRVPPTYITHPSVLEIFPELSSYKINEKVPCCLSKCMDKRPKNGCHHVRDTFRRTSESRHNVNILSPKIEHSEQIEVARHQIASSFSDCSLKAISECGIDESYQSDSDREIKKGGPEFDDADDLFDPEYVLPNNFQWWQETEDIDLTADENFDVVDVPDFREGLGDPHLWDDVDTFVSVVDVRDDDVASPDVYTPVYNLDRCAVTVWGLEIIWEEAEED